MRHRSALRGFWLFVAHLLILVGQGLVSVGEWINAGADPGKRP